VPHQVQTTATVGAGATRRIDLKSANVHVLGVVFQGVGEVVVGTDGAAVYTAPTDFLGVDRIGLWACSAPKACRVQVVEVAVRLPGRLVLGAGAVALADTDLDIQATLRASRSLSTSTARLVVLPLLSLGAAVLAHGLIGGTRIAGLLNAARRLATRI
jgi:hypothetical protein